MLRIFKITGSISYTWKIMISFIIVLLIPMVFFSAYIYQQSVLSVEKQSKTDLYDMLLQEKSTIELQLNNYEKILQQVSMNKTLSMYFYDNSLGDYDKVAFSMNYLSPFREWIKSTDSTNFDLRVFTPNENVFVNDWIFDSKQCEKEQWYKQASRAGYASLVWEPFHKRRYFYPGPSENNNSNSNNDLQTSVFIPFLNNYNDNGNSILELYFDSNSLFKNIEEALSKKNGILIVLNDHLNTMFCTDKTNVALEKKAVFWFKSLKNKSGDGKLNIGNDTYLINTQYISRLHTSLIVLSLQSNIMGNAYKVRNIFIVVLFFSILLIIAVAFILSKNLTSKVKKLVKAMRMVQQGYINSSVVISGNDEIAELGRDFNIMIDRINQYIEREFKSEILKKDALLKSLENQINPHFLYNTLESIKMMAVIKKEKEISDALTSLGSLLRYNISKNYDLSPIKIEVEQIRNYCNLENILLNGRLTFEVYMDDEIVNFLTLKLIMQPIVENAILHGFDNFDGKMVIALTVRRNEEFIEISIRDNGNGIEEERLRLITEWINGDSDIPEIKLLGNGVGLRNVHRRIQLKFGQDFGLRIISKHGVGTEIIVLLPTIEG